jgi:hypothetical protein
LQSNLLGELNNVKKKVELKDKIDFLKEVYRLRVQFYSEYTSRMWTRFNFLLTAEIGVLGLLISNAADPVWREELWLFPAAGIFISLIWYILGAQDRFYFEGFRSQIQYIENMIIEKLEINDVNMFAFGNPTDVKQDIILTWRWKFISLSRLVAAFPIFFLVSWIIALWFLQQVS